MNIVTKIKNLYAKKALSKTTLAILASSSLISLAGCSDGGHTVIDNNTNVSNELFIENAGPIPVLDGKSTATGIYVRNTSDKDINDINYIVENLVNNQNNSSSLSISQGDCKTIAAHSSCLLAITTPDLSLGGSGSNLLVANYNNKQDKQLVNYTYIDSKRYSGVNFSDGSQTIYGGNSYATTYVFVGNGQSQSDIGFNSSNNSVVVSNGLTNGKLNLAANQVVALEMGSNPNFTSRQVLITPYKVTSSKNLSQNLKLGSEVNGSLQVTITPTQQANLLMGNLPILTQAESSTVLTIVNNGNQNAANISLISDSGDIKVSSAIENPCGVSLIAGGSCNYQISLNNNYSNGSALLTLGYNNSLSTTITEQTVYYQNDESEPMVKLVPTQSQYTAQSNTNNSNNINLKAIFVVNNYVTFNVTNLGNAPLNNVVTSIRSSLQRGTVFNIRNNSCPSTLAAHGSCQVEVSITPSNNVDTGVLYLNMSGNFTGLAAKSYSFISLPVHINIIDTIAPTVISTTPANTGTDVSRSTGITLNFSESMEPTSLNNSNIWLQRESDGAIIQLLFQSVTNNNQTANFILPNGARLDSATEYQIMINPSSITDANGNAIGQEASREVSLFSTAFDPSPTITNYAPSDGGTNISQTPAMSITFSEQMDQSNLTPANIILKDQNGTPISGYTIQYNTGTLTATVVLANGMVLSDNTTYTLSLNQAAITDTTGNPLGSNSNYVVTEFTTGDFTAPVLSSVSPVNGATNISPASPLILTFSEPMNTSTLVNGNIKLRKNSDNSYITLIDPVYSNNDTTVTLTPSNNLLSGESYSIELNPSEIKDVAGNQMGQATSEIVSTISTVTPFSIISTNPVEASIVPVSQNNVTVTFNRAVDINSLSSANISLIESGSSNNLINTCSLLSESIATCSLTESFTNNTSYIYTITTDVRDSHGSHLQTGATINFATIYVSAQMRLASGASYACMLNQYGNVYCWGFNQTGSLGNGTYTDSNIPVLVSNGDKPANVPWLVISVGTSLGAKGTTCGVTTQGKAYCWGDNSGAAVGTTLTNANFSSPVGVVTKDGSVSSAIPSNTKLIAIDSTNTLACTLDIDGGAYC